MGTGDIQVHQVPDPEIVNPHDAILRVTRTAICGSDLHLYDGYIPTMEAGDAMMLETDRPLVLRQALQAVRKGGTLSIPGVYGGALDKVNFGAAFGKAVHMAMGQTHMHKYMKPLLQSIQDGKIDPSFLISHRVGIEEVPDMYKIWRDKKDQVTKIVIDPWRDQIGDAIAA